jgi:hypothetical protein
MLCIAGVKKGAVEFVVSFGAVGAICHCFLDGIDKVRESVNSLGSVHVVDSTTATAAVRAR